MDRLSTLVHSFVAQSLVLDPLLLSWTCRMVSDGTPVPRFTPDSRPHRREHRGDRDFDDRHRGPSATVHTLMTDMVDGRHHRRSRSPPSLAFRPPIHGSLVRMSGTPTKCMALPSPGTSPTTDVLPRELGINSVPIVEVPL